MSQEKLIAILKTFPDFAETYLKINTKYEGILPFKLNKAQLYIHERLEKQLQATGKVRALILKGRQLGSTTYVQGRIFRKVVTQKGKKAFILTHHDDATENVFEMTKFFNDNLPKGLIPVADTSSAKKLFYKTLHSGYAVGTAGNKTVGRSSTVQLLHASEVAYYKNADAIAKGILQTVPDAPHTEIIMESTANGTDNYFYKMWVAATHGKSEYQAIFVPWYWQTDYVADLKDGDMVSLDHEETKLLDLYGADGLTEKHLYWRRNKLNAFSSDYDTANELFSVEYPMCAVDAFNNPVALRMIKAPLVMKARNNRVESDAPLVIGVDPALGNNDRMAIIRRRGRLAYKLETYHNLNTMEIANLIMRIIEDEQPVKVFIDCIGIGAGVCDRLKEMGYQCVEPVNVAMNAHNKVRFGNLRCELWYDLLEWLAQVLPVQIPDSDELQSDLTSVGYKKPRDLGRLYLESKADLLKSPDTADALALTFYMGQYLNQSVYQVNWMPEKAAGMLV